LYEQIGNFFEKCFRCQYPPAGTTTWNEMWPGNFRFFQYELFLYLIGLLIKNQRFSEVRIFVDRVYYLPEEARSSHNRIARFDVFRTHCASLDHVRKQRLKLNRLSIVADLVKERASRKDLTFTDLMQAECVLLVESMINATATHPWFAVTLIYAHYSRTFELFARAASKKDFVKLKTLFFISTKEEFVQQVQTALEKYKINTRGIFWHGHIDMANLLGLQQLDSLA
jgi:hypothetical protein